MKHSELRDQLPIIMKTKIPLLLWGETGIGKTQGVRDFCSRNSYHFVSIHLATQETGDLLGLPSIEAGITAFAEPIWLAALRSFCQKNLNSQAILFLDEFNRARPDVLQASFQLLLEHRLHDHILPDNCYVMAAGNVDTGDYNVTSLDDAALLSRFCQVKLEPTLDEFFDYMVAKEFDKNWLALLCLQPQLIEVAGKVFELSVRPTRRSAEFVDRLLKASRGAVHFELIAGLMGTPAALAYQEFCASAEKPLKGEEILDSGPAVGKKLDTWLKDITNLRMDLITESNNALFDLVSGMESITAQQWSNIQAYVEIIPSESGFFLLQRLAGVRPCFDQFHKDKDVAVAFIRKIKGKK